MDIKNCKFQFFLILIVFIIIEITFFSIENNYYTQTNSFSSYTPLELKSKCHCNKDVLFVEKHNEHMTIEVINSETNKTLNYSIPLEEYKQLQITCDLYKTFRRGMNQKIIGFSLYGSNNLYYQLVGANLIRAKQFYPDYTARIYHDASINKSIICELECSMSNVDFCDVTQLPNDFNVNFMLPMSWRWLPIGDSFVSLFLSRDTDSCIFAREVAAVKEWLKSNTVFHIMRDHPSHGPVILGGMWGFYNKISRQLANKLFKIITNKFIQYWYRIIYPVKFVPKGQDQFLLNWYFWPIAKQNATVHDSYHCKELGGQPFPTQRPKYSNCYVGNLGCCETEPNSKKWAHVCSPECRPKDKINEWIYC